ncbi:MAG: hypothetical protein A2075_19230 [Geobacteraceae bacterium GWC2_58_44]|nr:MAG: hypothetical protein A2075_19230 [Geobacteraceae bacterium GWC2_58_44]
MKKLTMMITLLAISIMVAAPLTANAAAGKKAKSEVVMKIGNKVHLFHSSNVEAQKDIAIGDVITVYRQLGGKTPQPKEVGELKVLSFIGPHYFEAEITKGEVKVGDVAKKDKTSLLVQPAR